jgi:hypothetical protein
MANYKVNAFWRFQGFTSTAFATEITEITENGNGEIYVTATTTA